jgi:hypothetical protein
MKLYPQISLQIAFKKIGFRADFGESKILQFSCPLGFHFVAEN